MNGGSSTKPKENVQYRFAWDKSERNCYVWLTPTTYTVRGVVHFWEALCPGSSCKVYPVKTWKQIPMDSRLVDIDGRCVYITKHAKSPLEREVQTDVGGCVDLSELQFRSELDQAIINSHASQNSS